MSAAFSGRIFLVFFGNEVIQLQPDSYKLSGCNCMSITDSYKQSVIYIFLCKRKVRIFLY